MILSLDWAHTESKVRTFDGKTIGNKWPKAEENLIILCENIPDKYAKPYLDAGVTILRCSTNVVAKYRTKHNIEKSDDNDVQIIYQLYIDDSSQFFNHTISQDILELKNLYRLRQDQQQSRIRMSNRLFADHSEAIEKIKKEMESLEGKTERQIKKLLTKFPIYTDFLEPIPGIGTVISAALIVKTGNIKRFPNFRCLCKQWGLNVDDEGKAPKKRKGCNAAWDHEMRSILLGSLATVFNMGANKEYRQMIDDEKERQRQLHPELSPGQTLNRAKRFAVKKFLSKFFAQYKKTEMGELTEAEENAIVE